MKIRPAFLLAIVSLMIGGTIPFAIANPTPEVSNLAQATEENLERGQFKRERRQKLIEELDLTPEQVQQLEDIRGDKPQAREDYEALKAEMETLRNLIANSASTTELRSQHQKIQAMRQELGSARFEKMLKMYEVLTPEQRQTFAEKMKHRFGRKGRFGRRHRHHGQSGELQSHLMF